MCARCWRQNLEGLEKASNISPQETGCRTDTSAPGNLIRQRQLIINCTVDRSPRGKRSMKSLQRAAVAAVVLAVASFATDSPADPVPSGWEANNMEPTGYSRLENRKGAFKMAIKKVNGRWYLYMGHLWHYVWSIVDVTDPGEPKFLKTVPGPGNTWTLQMTLH